MLIGVLCAVALLLAAAGWYYSGEILGPDPPPGKTGQTVLARTDSTITLVATRKAKRAGEWAIEWPGGFGRIGPLLEVGGSRVITTFRVASGILPDTTSRLAGFAPDADPRTWLGGDFEDIRIPARIGPLPAWRIPGRDSTWAVFVHGRAATRAEVLRMLPAYQAMGLPCLVISYRNDAGVPIQPGGGYRLGLTEWQDLEDAVRETRRRGARGVVVVGCSMGGAIVAQFLRRSPERAFTRAAVLDAPALDWNVVIGVEGAKRHVPAVITEWGKIVTSLRSGLQWNELDQAAHAREFSTPMLILHGSGDDVVPLTVSERFARARQDLVTLEVFPGAGHVESVNFDRLHYDRVLTRWLRTHVPARTGRTESRGP